MGGVGGRGATKMCGVGGKTKRWGRNHGRGGAKTAGDDDLRVFLVVEIKRKTT